MCDDFLGEPAVSSVDVRFSRFPLTATRLPGIPSQGTVAVSLRYENDQSHSVIVKGDRFPVQYCNCASKHCRFYKASVLHGSVSKVSSPAVNLHTWLCTLLTTYFRLIQFPPPPKKKEILFPLHSNNLLVLVKNTEYAFWKVGTEILIIV